MAKAKKPKIEGDSPKKAKIEGDVAVVSYSGGTREFSLEVHGDNFAELAREFAAKHKGTIVGAAEEEVE